jgi:hypothetical protein
LTKMQYEKSKSFLFYFISELLVSLPLTIILPSLVMKQSLFAAKNLPTVDSNGTIETILQTLGAVSLECQQRLICDMIASPKKYRPLSDIIYLMLRYVNFLLSSLDLLLLLLVLPSKRGFSFRLNSYFTSAISMQTLNSVNGH